MTPAYCTTPRTWQLGEVVESAKLWLLVYGVYLVFKQMSEFLPLTALAWFFRLVFEVSFYQSQTGWMEV